MAQFKIFLLTPILSRDKSTINFLKTSISEFYTQNTISEAFTNQYSYCYTFNEKLKKHTNGQKELTFSMLRKVWLDNTWTTNPFVSNIHNGTQLLLIDKYNNEIIFTVKNINYNLGQDNITYDFTCQDSFTYQAIRQNDGYTIDNNADSEEFVGAKSIDWWVVNRIQPECHLGYEYIPLEKGLYLKTNGELITFSEDDSLTEVDKIIKPCFSMDKYPEYHEKIPFSVSGSNCSAALISLGEETGMMLNFKEHSNNSSSFSRYFWFEPTKNESVSNLEYSPYSSTQSFGFSQAGDSLTTVLNVESNTIDEEIISLIPNIPLFFTMLFQDESWSDSSYCKGYFSSICQGKVFNQNNLDFSIGETITGNDSWYFSIFNNENEGKKTFILPKYYTKISFESGDNKSYIVVDGKQYTSSFAKWHLVEKIGNEYIEYDSISNPIPEEKLGTNIEAYVKIPKVDTGESVSLSSLILNFHRDTTQEELEFAEIADNCPWLENKLIDFHYFYQQNIINKSEYTTLLNKIKNELRIVNGKLLVYTKQYYDAVHSKTKFLANVINDLDSLSATYHADVIDFFERNGTVQNYDYFRNAYDVIVNTYYRNPNPIPILNHEELLSEYFNKYFKAQQRFLKNIYNFREYFYAPASWSSNNQIYKHTFTLTKNGNKYISFKEYHLSLINEDFNQFDSNTGKPFVNIYDKDNNVIFVVNSENYDKCFIPKTEKDSFIKAQGEYDSNKIYYKILYRVNKGSAEPSPIGGETLVLYKQDETYNYYTFEKSDGEIDFDTILNEVNDTNKDNIVYEPLTLKEIFSEFLYRKKNEYKGYAYYHDTNTYNTIENNWLSLEDMEQIEKINKEKLWGSLGIMLTPFAWVNSIGSESDRWEIIYDKIDDYKFGNNVTNTDNYFKNFKGNFEDDFKKKYRNAITDLYVEHFPITSVRLQGAQYKESATTFKKGEENKKCAYQKTNREGNTVQEYAKWWLSYEKKETSEIMENPSDYIKDYDLTLVTPSNENNFYRRVVKTPFWGYALGGLAAAGAIGGGPIISAIQYQIVSDFVFKNAKTCWDTSGKNNKFCDDSKENHGVKEGYYNFSKLNYITFSDAYDKYTELKESNEYLIGKISDNSQEINENDVILATYGTKTLRAKPAASEQVNLKEYFNYYSLFGLTYSAALNEAKLLYKDSFLRPLKLGDLVNPNYRYKILFQKKGEDDNLVFFNTGYHPISRLIKTNDNIKWEQRFSKVVYYPIANNLDNVDFSIMPSSGQCKTLKEMLTEAWGEEVLTPSANKDDYYITAEIPFEDGTEQKVGFYIFQEEDFVRTKVDFETDRNNIYNGKTIYLEDNENYMGQLNFFSQKDLVNGLFVVADKDDNFEQAQSFKEDGKYYRNVNGNYERVYTIKQIKDLKHFYFSEAFNHIVESFSKNIKEINFKVYLHEEKNKDNNHIVIEYPGFLTLKEDDIKNELIEIPYQNKIYKSELTYKTEEVENLSKMSNGDFWYKFINKNESPILQQHALLIETQLTEYWNQAYNASKYCEFFLPERWQSNLNGSSNHFTKSILSWKDEKLTLLNTFIPQVKKYSNGKTVRLPSYDIQYGFDEESENSDNNKGEINKKEISNANKSLKENIVFINAFEELEEDFNNFYVEENGKTTYYYATFGGMKWKDLLPSLRAGSPYFENFNGLYLMTYKILKTYFTNYSLKEYKEAKDRHDAIWDELYSDFPGLILENVYSNTNATTSQDLYVLSKNAFKDLSEPEKGYTISLIDCNALRGYQGQELNIGDGIKVNVEEFYDEADIIKKALSQYLFITDISYDLRKDSDIQLTVNSIKYQDKLIQRLVKLIK